MSMNPLHDWFARNGWSPFPFQEQTWQAYRNGCDGMLHAPTGMGKTMAVWGGPLLDFLLNPQRGKSTTTLTEPLRVLWITPLRALARDTTEALRAPVEAMQLPWSIELRTGDTSQTARKKQRDQLPTALVTTPESISILLSYPGARERFESLRCVVVDEWHELVGNKRGVQTQLAMARLRSIAPNMRIWGMSATLANTEQAMHVLLGPKRAPLGKLIQGNDTKEIVVDTIRPIDAERFPWSGHIGTTLLPQVIEAIEQYRTTLLFTNVRSQTEIWFQALLTARPDWIGDIALHHGSLDRDLRAQVETLLDAGKLKCVVCTSSLDLGVDFAPVEQVIQIGSPKGIARLLQRAGRSGHQPGAISRVLGVPTNALELIEYSAAREAVQHRRIEPRVPLEKPLDVLVQHLVTIAMGDGFDELAMREEMRGTHAYRELTDQQWQWAMDFITHGGPTLRAYNQYAKVVHDGRRWHVPSQPIARLHRMSIGTITSDASMNVRYVTGKSLGSIEESFISRLKPGDRFVFAGKILELVRVRDLTAQVKKATSKRGTVPRWMGGRSPLSTELADAVRVRVDQARQHIYVDDEMRLIQPLLELQARWSQLPALDELLIETTSMRGMHHAYVFTLAGRLVNEGLAALVAHRLTAHQPCTLSVTANDWGFELVSEHPFALEEQRWRGLFSIDQLLDDLLTCVNTSALAQRRFRDIARIAGLIQAGYPGQRKPARHLQASSNLFFEVFQEFDLENLLLDQARREVLEAELEFVRLAELLKNLEQRRITIVPTDRLTPFAFPLWVETIRSADVSSERWIDRVRRMVEQLESQASHSADPATRRNVKKKAAKPKEPAGAR